MKTTIGKVMIIAGAVFGLWAGIGWAFIGGIVDVIAAVRAPDLVAMDVAIGVAKILFAGPIGGVAAIIAIYPGWAVLQSTVRSKGRGERGEEER
jgi:hypothetical protein